MSGGSESGVRPGSGWVAFAGCCLIWGSTFLAISIGNRNFPAVWAACLRLALAAVLLTAITLLSRQKLPRGAARRAAVLYGLFNFGINFPLLYWGERTVPSGLTAVMYATIPLSTALFAYAFHMERFAPRRVAGAAVALAGVAAIFWHQFATALPVVPLIAVLMAATSAAFSTVLLKRGPPQSPFGANAVAALVGLPLCLIASFALREPHPFPSGPDAWIPIVYLTVAGSVGAFVMFAWLVNRWPVSRVSYVAVIVPVVALLLGAAVRHEPLSLASGFGAGLVLAGVLVGLHGS